LPPEDEKMVVRVERAEHGRPNKAHEAPPIETPCSIGLGKISCRSTSRSSLGAECQRPNSPAISTARWRLICILNHVPTMAEGAGREDDAGMLFGKLFPPDVIMPNQHTVGQDHRRNGDQLHDTAPID
jgi:hypothetical protein